MRIKTVISVSLICFASLTFAQGKPEHAGNHGMPDFAGENGPPPHAQANGHQGKHHDDYENHEFDKSGRKSKDMRRNVKPRDPDRDFERPKQRRSGERPGRSSGRERAR